jgi:hypothetical protein
MDHRQGSSTKNPSHVGEAFNSRDRRYINEAAVQSGDVDYENSNELFDLNDLMPRSNANTEGANEIQGGKTEIPSPGGPPTKSYRSSPKRSDATPGGGW